MFFKNPLCDLEPEVSCEMAEKKAVFVRADDVTAGSKIKELPVKENPHRRYKLASQADVTGCAKIKELPVGETTPSMKQRSSEPPRDVMTHVRRSVA